MGLIGRTTSAGSVGDRIIKVNHSGENGAICIYSGQIALARLTAPHMIKELMEFRAHECRHRAIFEAELRRRGRPRCRSYWLCGVGGYVLGVVTGLFGATAIAATTVAVESVVLRHLEQQLDVLRGVDCQATTAILAIVDEEQQHHDHSVLHESVEGFWPRVLKPVVSASTEAVIWLGMRL